VQAWGDHILGRLRPKAKALYQAGRFTGVEDGRAVFGLPNQIHRQRCEDIRGDVEPALAEHFHRRIPLTLVVDDGSGSAGTDATPTPAPAPARHPEPTPPSPVEPPPVAAPVRPEPAAVAPEPAPAYDDDPSDLSDFDESELGEVATGDHSARARVIEAFPGAEEVG
jgi:hypothetical protein